ncbi:hypothetical protein [Streptomyces sp. NPDC054854]
MTSESPARTAQRLFPLLAEGDDVVLVGHMVSTVKGPGDPSLTVRHTPG